jgi:hypothetical protein
VIESVTQLDGVPVPQVARWRAPVVIQRATARLTVPGAVALAGGLATLWCFLLPWLVASAGALGTDPVSTPTNQGQSTDFLATRAGWDIARGLVMEASPQAEVRVTLFIHLWLIPLAAVALLAVGGYAAQRRISARLAAGCTVAVAALVLLVELGYVVQVATLAQVFPISIGVAWGAWLAMAVSVALCVTAANLLRPASALAGNGEVA